MFKKNKKILDTAVMNWIKKSNDPKKTYVIGVIHKKNKKLYYSIVQLDNEIAYIDKTPHYAGDDSIFFKKVKLGKTSYDVPYLDIYEGNCVAVHPCKTTDDIKFSNRVVDMIALSIEKGFLDKRRHMKMDIRKILLGGLIGIAAIMIISKMF